MTGNRLLKIIGGAGLLFLGACVAPGQVEQYSSSAPGFAKVSGTSRTATGKDTVWIQNRQQAEANAKRVHGLVHKKTIGADTAVQVALLNNRGLQAAYSELGMSAADVWQQTMLPNPVAFIGITGIGAEDLDGYRTIEGSIATNIMALATLKQRVRMADVEFRQAQLRAAEATLGVALEARRAWIDAVAAFEVGGLIRKAEAAADAGSELAEQLGRTGSMNKAEQAREHAFYAELVGERAKAGLEARLAKERLTRVMGLWGTEVDYYVPNALPRLPSRGKSNPQIEAQALATRVDLTMARVDLAATAQRYNLTNATRYMSDVELGVGFESEREATDDGIETGRTGTAELAFEIPIFDSGKARLRKGETAYMRAANILAEKSVNVRSEARAAHLAYSTTHGIAAHYRNAVLPLRETVEEEALLSYSGMITSTFELLEDTSARLETAELEVEARQDFWLAEANMMAAIYGGDGSFKIAANEGGDD